MPEIIKKFLLYFRNAINEGMVYEMQNLYENTYVYINILNMINLYFVHLYIYI